MQPGGYIVHIHSYWKYGATTKKHDARAWVALQQMGSTSMMHNTANCEFSLTPTKIGNSSCPKIKGSQKF